MGNWWALAPILAAALVALVAIRRISEPLCYVVAAGVAMLTALAVWLSVAP